MADEDDHSYGFFQKWVYAFVRRANERTEMVSWDGINTGSFVFF
jgi:hypothetical protein